MENPSEKWKARAVLVVIANLILGMGVALLRLAGFGTDPFTCMKRPSAYRIRHLPDDT